MTENAVEGLDCIEDAKHVILFVDDEKSILSSLRRLFRTSPYELLTAISGAEALDILKVRMVDLVVSDMRMPEMDGAEFLTKVASQWPETIRILLTGYSDLESTIAAVNNGRIYRYLSKPWEENDLRMTIHQALEKKTIEKERDRLLLLTSAQNAELLNLNQNLEKTVEARTEQIRKTFHQTILIFSQLVELREKKR
jgi:response regulator RpfG family c-di-GMP phosphodiesterase